MAQVIYSSHLKDDLVITYEKYIENIRMKLNSILNTIEAEGKLFETFDEYALRYSVFRDFKVSQGIVLEFRRKFGQIHQLIKQDQKITEIASIKSKQRQILCIIYLFI